MRRRYLAFCLVVENLKFLGHINVGDEIVIVSKCSIQDESGFGVYDSELYVNGELGARAVLNVMSPDEEFVKKALSE